MTEITTLELQRIIRSGGFISVVTKTGILYYNHGRRIYLRSNKTGSAYMLSKEQFMKDLPKL